MARRLYNTNEPSQKLPLLLSLCEHHQSLHRDSLDEYANIAYRLALQSNDRLLLAKAELALGDSYIRWGWTDSALSFIESALTRVSLQNPDERPTYFRVAREKALCYGMQIDYNMTLTLLYDLVTQGENYNDSLSVSANMNTIGSVALARNEAQEALKWLDKAMTWCSNHPQFYSNITAIQINKANAYFKLDNMDSAGYYIQLAVPLARKTGNMNLLATALRVKSSICLDKGKIPEASQALEEMVEIRRNNNDNDILVDDNIQLINFYLTTEQFEKAIAFCNEKLIRGDIYAKESDPKTFTNNIKLRIFYYESLAKAYKATGNIQKYSSTLEQLIAARDSSYEADAAASIAEVQTRYEVQKKENTIIQQKLDITRKNFILYSSLFIAVLLLIIAWLGFKNFSRKQQLKLKLMQEEEKRLALEAVKNAEEKERVRIAADLHDNLGAYAASISSNLEYISVPEADKKNLQALKELKINARSIVSQLSDTIWALNKESLSLTAVSDRIKLFLQRISGSYPDVTMEVEEKITEDMSFPPSQAFHLFQIIQEAVTNAIKHSGADKIIIYITSEARWQISIADNGKGIDPDNNYRFTSEGGNGITNMKHRAEESGWDIQWIANKPGGTAVVIQPDTTN